jgi:hypothetical protein
LALPLQIVIPGSICFYLVLWMGLGAGMSPHPDRIGLLPLVVLGGAVIGVLVWLIGLIADRASLVRLALTVALSILALSALFLVDPGLWTRVVPDALVYAAIAAPLVGALAGYYWLWHKLHTEGQ